MLSLMPLLQVAWLDHNMMPLTYEDRRVVDDARFSIERPVSRVVDDARFIIMRPDSQEWNLQVNCQIARLSVFYLNAVDSV